MMDVIESFVKTIEAFSEELRNQLFEKLKKIYPEQFESETFDLEKHFAGMSETEQLELIEKLNHRKKKEDSFKRMEDFNEEESLEFVKNLRENNDLDSIVRMLDLNKGNDITLIKVLRKELGKNDEDDFEKLVDYLKKNPKFLRLHLKHPKISKIVSEVVKFDPYVNFKFIPKEHQSVEILETFLSDKMVKKKFNASRFRKINFDLIKDCPEDIISFIYNKYNKINENPYIELEFIKIPKEYQTLDYVKKFIDKLKADEIEESLLDDDLIMEIIEINNKWDNLKSIKEHLNINNLKKFLTSSGDDYHPDFIKFLMEKENWVDFKKIILDSNKKLIFTGKDFIGIYWCYEDYSISRILSMVNENIKVFETLYIKNEGFNTLVNNNQIHFQHLIDQLHK